MKRTGIVLTLGLVLLVIVIAGCKQPTGASSTDGVWKAGAWYYCIEGSKLYGYLNYEGTITRETYIIDGTPEVSDATLKVLARKNTDAPDALSRVFTLTKYAGTDITVAKIKDTK